MRRVLLTIVLSVAVVGAGATAATAQAPERFRNFNEAQTISAGVDCPFALHVDIVEDNQQAMVFPPKRNGDVVVRIVGHLVVRITNVDNGRSVVLNVSGPVEQIFHADGTHHDILRGPNALGIHPGDEPNGPQLLYFTGRAVALVTADNVLTLESFAGRQPVNLCETLATPE